MWDDTESLVVGLSWLVQLLGVCGVTAARLRTRKSTRRSGDWFILSCFAIVGVLSALLMGQCNGCGLAMATTMPLMAVGATLDLKRAPRSTPF
jgi:hypothetical protein